MARRRPHQPAATTKTLDSILARSERTLSALAQEAGVARRTLFGARMGRMPRGDTIGKLARVLGVTPDCLRAAIKANQGAPEN